MKKKSFIKSNKRNLMLFICFVAIFFISTQGLFAAGNSSIAVLDDAGDQILNLIGAKWVKAILAVALVIEFGVVAFGNAQGNGDIIKKVLPWVIGTAGVLGATSIVNFFFSNIDQEELAMAVSSAINFIS